MPILSRLLIHTVSLGAALFAGSTGALAEDPQPPIEENHDYPQADEIFAERGIRLLKGDGHILFVDCATSAEVVKVESRRWSGSGGIFCFQVKGAKGYLSMELPEAYLIKGDDHTITATVTIDGRIHTIAVKKNEWTPVGEGSSPESGPATLVELRASP